MIGANTLLMGMFIRVTPSEQPIEVVSVETFDREGEPCWLIIGKPHRVKYVGGGCVEHVRYIVPQTYRGARPA